MAEEFNPFEPVDPARLFPRLSRLRADAPVVALGEGMFYVTRYDEARQVLRDAEHFSNAEGFRAPGITVPVEDRMLGEQDVPQHPQVRRIVMTAFNPAAVKREEPFVRDRARQLLARVPVPGPADLVPLFTNPLPNDATVHLLGFPMDDSAQIASWSKEVMESEWPAMNRTERGEGMAGAFPEYTGYVDAHLGSLQDSLEGGSAGPAGEGLIARLMTESIEGKQLTHRQLRALVFNLLLGGLTTTAQLLGNMIYELLTTDALSALVGADAGDRAQFIEETLRMYPPVMFVPRGCVQETTVAGTTIRPGERVIVGTACANRDESLFEDGEGFDPHRPGLDRHLTFGFGPHLCAGAAMARSVAEIGLDEFVRFADGRGAHLPEGFEYQNVPTFFEYGPVSLPVAFDGPARGRP